MTTKAEYGKESLANVFEDIWRALAELTQRIEALEKVHIIQDQGTSHIDVPSPVGNE